MGEGKRKEFCVVKVSLRLGDMGSSSYTVSASENLLFKAFRVSFSLVMFVSIGMRSACYYHVNCDSVIDGRGINTRWQELRRLFAPSKK